MSNMNLMATTDPCGSGLARDEARPVTEDLNRYLLRQKQQAQEHHHENRNTRHPPLVVHHAHRVHHL
ncbi:hypothetical protein EMIT0196MI5_110134 [Pseudomonas sp. IT-196MI5]